jgi:hypothetical protein
LQVTYPACFLQIRRIFSVTVRRPFSRVTPQFSRLISSCPLPRLLAPEPRRLFSRPIPSRELFPSCVPPRPLIFSVPVFRISYSCSFFFRVQIYN